jgi:hypothetical protein
MKNKYRNKTKVNLALAKYAKDTKKDLKQLMQETRLHVMDNQHLLEVPTVKTMVNTGLNFLIEDNQRFVELLSVLKPATRITEKA